MMNFNIYNGGEEPEKVLLLPKEEIEKMNFCVFLKNKYTDETKVKITNYICDEDVFKEKYFSIKKGFNINYNAYMVLKWLPINEYNCLFDFHKTDYYFTNEFKLNIPIEKNFSYIIEISKSNKEDNCYPFKILEKRENSTRLIYTFHIKKVLYSNEETYIIKKDSKDIFKLVDYSGYKSVKNIFLTNIFKNFPKFYREYFEEGNIFYNDLVYMTNKLDSYYND